MGHAGPVRKLVRNVLVVLLAFVAGAVWADRDQLSGVDAPSISTIMGVSHAALEVDKGRLGRFHGTVEVTNRTRTRLQVVVRVTPRHEGDQLGRLVGEVTLSPGATAGVELHSVDAYEPYDETDVELLPIPKG